MDSNSSVLALVIEDLLNRAEVGFKKYGCTLDQSKDDMLQHLYEELLDATMYIKTEIRKRQEGEAAKVPFAKGGGGSELA